MNEHETTELMERLVTPLEPTEPPIWELIERGRRARGRRRGAAVGLVAAAVAAVVGGTTVVAQQLADSSNEPVQPQTSPTGDASTVGEVKPVDLLGSWEPREVLGKTLSPTDGALPGLLFRDGNAVVAATDYCEVTVGQYTLGTAGGLEISNLTTSYPYCVGPDGPVQRVANDVVAYRADTVQVTEGVLTVYDGDGEVLGVYEREWADVDASDLLGRWRLLSPYSAVSITLEELRKSLERSSLQGRALVTFFADRYAAEDGVNTTAGRYELGELGAFRDWDQSTTLVGCIATLEPRDQSSPAYPPVEPMPVVPPTNSPELGEACERVPNPEILDEAVRVQWFDKMGLLVFYDESGMSIGTYLPVPDR